MLVGVLIDLYVKDFFALRSILQHLIETCPMIRPGLGLILRMADDQWAVNKLSSIYNSLYQYVWFVRRVLWTFLEEFPLSPRKPAPAAIDF